MNFRNYLLSALSAADMALLNPHLTEVSLERGETLFEAGDDIDRVCFPGTAVLSVATPMRDGQPVESSTVGHESASPLLWALAGEPARGQIFTQIGGAAMCVPARVLRAAAAASPALNTLLLHHVTAISFQAEQGAACNVRHGAVPRLARWLLMTQDRTGGRLLPLTQDHMAIMIGTRRTTVSAIASYLRDQRLIRYSRGVVEILDRAGLEAKACECYRVIRAEFDSLRKKAPA